MKTQPILIVLALILLLPVALYAQDQGIFTYVEKPKMKLSNQQQNSLSVIESHPQTEAVYFVAILESDEWSDQNKIILNFSHQTIEAVKDDNSEKLQRKSSWVGKIKDNSFSTILLSFRNGRIITGHINTGDKIYTIKPFNKQLHLLIETNPEAYPKEGQPIISDTSKLKNKNNHKERALDPAESFNSDPVIRVLVAYTPAAQESYTTGTADVRDLILHGGDLANISFSNSNISASMEIVAMVKVDYVEDLSDSMSTDLNRLRLTSDGYMDEVHQLRNDFDADVVALIVDEQADVCGRAFQRSFSSTAFSVTKFNCIDTYTFAHEVGHNLAAHHDQANGTNQHYQYGHGYNFWYSTQLKGTIMSYPGAPVNYWSNPDIDFMGGPAMGTAQYEDNARVWDVRASTVENFRTTTTGKLVYSSGYTFDYASPVTIAEGITIEIGGDLEVASGSDLTFGDGVDLEFSNNAKLVVNGTARIGDGVSITDPWAITVAQNAKIEFAGDSDIEFLEKTVTIPGYPPLYAPGYLEIRGEVESSMASYETVTMKLSSSSTYGVWSGINVYSTASGDLDHVRIEDAQTGLNFSSVGSNFSVYEIEVVSPEDHGINSSSSSFYGDYVVITNSEDRGISISGGSPEINYFETTSSDGRGIHVASYSNTYTTDGEITGSG